MTCLPFHHVPPADVDIPLLVIGDHAMNHLPKTANGLGLPPGVIEQHVGFDIGSEGLVRGLAGRFGAGAVMAGFSRLYIDPNRDTTRFDSIVEVADGLPVPGNQGLTQSQRDARICDMFHPYHDGLARSIDSLRQRHRDPLLVSIHTFTPAMAGQERPWHAGVLWHHDRLTAKAALSLLRRESDLCIGDQEPYPGNIFNYTMDRHAGRPGLRHLTLEVRQDLVDHDEGVAEWVDRLSRTVKEVIVPVTV